METASEIKRQAQLLGRLYLLLTFLAPFGIIYVPRALMVPGDPAATASRIRASETLFRLGMASRLASVVLFAIVVLALYRLFRRVNGTQAALMALLGLASVPISFMGVVTDLAALALLGRPDYLSVFDGHQIEVLTYLCLRMRSLADLVAGVFWGLWLFPFAILVVRSGFIPTVFGFLLIPAGVGYLAGSLTTMVLPGLAPLVSPWVLILAFGEVPLILWLAIRGSRPSGRPATAVA